jgi:phosphate/sulfate permease
MSYGFSQYNTQLNGGNFVSDITQKITGNPEISATVVVLALLGLYYALQGTKSIDSKMSLTHSITLGIAILFGLLIIWNNKDNQNDTQNTIAAIVAIILIVGVITLLITM